MNFFGTDTFTYTVNDDDGATSNSATVTVTVTPVSDIAGRRIFYNNSFFDGFSSGAGISDDGAIAPDKEALLPGETADFGNYTSYSRGINGVIVDIEGLGATPTLATIGNFFEFQVGNDNSFASYTTAPAPIEVAVRAGEGAGGSDRVTIIWADNVIEKQWLEITVLANANTGLVSEDVHYWGNAVGETGDNLANTDVSATDQAMTRDNFTTFLTPAGITNPYDFNRDTDVSATDQAIARDNFTTFINVLQLISPPPAPLSSLAASSISSDDLLSLSASSFVVSLTNASPTVSLSPNGQADTTLTDLSLNASSQQTGVNDAALTDLLVQKEKETVE